MCNRKFMNQKFTQKHFQMTISRLCCEITLLLLVKRVTFLKFWVDVYRKWNKIQMHIRPNSLSITLLTFWTIATKCICGSLLLSGNGIQKSVRDTLEHGACPSAGQVCSVSCARMLSPLSSPWPHLFCAQALTASYCGVVSAQGAPLI